MTDGSNPYAPPPPGPPTDSTYNPYAPPSARIGGGEGEIAEAEAIRQQYLKHEASIRSVGCLYLWSGVILLGFTALGLLVTPFIYMTSRAEFDDTEGFFFYAGMIAVYGAFGAASYWIGKGLRKLDPKVRTLATILFLIGLLGFPVGTIISAYFLYLLHSEKGKTIMTTEYQQIVEQTPHIKYRTSWVAWLVLFLLIAGIIGLIVALA